ncbi:MAG: energy-coupling factor transporter transmembrane component T [Bacillota bacterium]
MNPRSPYVHRPSSIHRLNPLTKGVLFLCTVVIAFATSSLTTVLALLGAVVAGSAAARVARELARTVAKSAFVIVALIFIVQGLFYPGSRTPLYVVGPLTIWQEGLRFACFTASRLLAIIGATVLLMLTTRPEDLVSELMARGLSRKLGFVVLMTMQIIPNMQARAAAILDAQRSRGLETEGRLIQRFRAFLPLMGPLVVGSIISLETRSLAIEARGFSSPTKRVRIEDIPDTRWESLVRWGASLATFGFVVWRLVRWISSLIR